MNTIRCLVVDDEPLSQEVILNYIMEIPGLALCGTCRNAIEALETLKEKEIDLIFLDINMPKLSGIDLVRSLSDPPMVIFTTAYPEFALEGYEVDALDYLVKPVSFERFLKAANKARDQYDLKRRRYISQEMTEDKYISLKSDKKIYRVNERDIRYIHSMGDYIKVFTRNKVIIVAETMKNIESRLSSRFIRIHKTVIVSGGEISYLEGNQVRIGDQFLPVGPTYRDELLEKLKTGNR